MLTLDSKTPGNGTCLVEPLGGFSNGGCHFIVVVHFICDLHFAVVLHFISRLLYHATGTQSWLLRPVKASTGSDLYPDYFWLSFLFHLPHIRQFWVGIFHPQAFFTLCSFPTFLAQPVFIKASLGAGSSSLKFAGLYTDPWNTALAHLFVWFTVILNPLHILNLYLYMSILQKLYLWCKLWLKKYFFQVQFLRIRLLSR